MPETRAVFRMQFSHMLARRECKIAFTAAFALIAFSFCQLCGKMRGLDQSQLYAASYGWVGNGFFFDLQSIQLFFYLLIFILGALPFADSQYVDRKINARPMLLTRCPRGRYILAGAAAAFCGAFLVVSIPLLFFQLLSFLIFPLRGSVPVFSAYDPAWAEPLAIKPLFPYLLYNHPYLYNLLTVFYASATTGLFALLSFSIAFLVQRGRLLIVVLPTLLLLVEGMIFPTHGYIYYLYALGGMQHMTLGMYFGVPAGLCALCAALLAFQIHSMRDELT